MRVVKYAGHGQDKWKASQSEIVVKPLTRFYTKFKEKESFKLLLAIKVENTW